MLQVETSRPVPPELAAAVRALETGEPVLIFDAPDREGETDLVILSELATPELIRLLRRDAGGWICTAISDELRVRLGLPFYADLLGAAAPDFPILKDVGHEQLRYDARSPFGLHVHHRSTYTGIPDNDRATGIRALGELARDAPGSRARRRNGDSRPSSAPRGTSRSSTRPAGSFPSGRVIRSFPSRSPGWGTFRSRRRSARCSVTRAARGTWKPPADTPSSTGSSSWTAKRS